jgi:hypothetical protein
MQPCDGQKSARDRHARRGQPLAEPVEQRFRRCVVSSGLDEPSMQGDEVGYAGEIWHALEKWRVGPHGAMPFPSTLGMSTRVFKYARMAGFHLAKQLERDKPAELPPVHAAVDESEVGTNGLGETSAGLSTFDPNRTKKDWKSRRAVGPAAPRVLSFGQVGDALAARFAWLRAA